MKKRHSKKDDSKAVWAIEMPTGHDFAEFEFYDEDEEDEEEGSCPECGGGDAPKPECLANQVWSDGEDQIGDFTSAYGYIVARSSVIDSLAKAFKGIERAPVTFEDSPKLRKPKTITKRTKKRVWMPYEGPPLEVLWAPHAVDPDESSTITWENNCDICDNRIYKRFDGVADLRGGDIVPRKPGKGFFIKKKAIGKYSIFRIRFTLVTLCTTEVKEFCEQHGYTNVRFLEYGDII